MTLRMLRRIRVGDVMTSPVHTTPRSSSAHDVAQLMARNSVNHVIVLDDRGRVAGVVSDRDIRAAQPSVLLVREETMRHKALSLVRTEELMVEMPVTVTPDTTARRAADLMTYRRIGCLPVVDEDGHPLGILTGLDMLRLAVRALDQATEAAEG